MTFDLPDVTAMVLKGLDPTEVAAEEGDRVRMGFVKKKVLEVLREAYMKEQKKVREKATKEKDKEEVERIKNTYHNFNQTAVLLQTEGGHVRRKREVIPVDIPTLKGHVQGKLRS